MNNNNDGGKQTNNSAINYTNRLLAKKIKEMEAGKAEMMAAAIAANKKIAGLNKNITYMALRLSRKLIDRKISSMAKRKEIRRAYRERVKNNPVFVAKEKARQVARYLKIKSDPELLARHRQRSADYRTFGTSSGIR